MRIFNLTLLLTFFIAVFTSCEEDVMIKGEFRHKYILNSVVDGNDSTQIVSILENFNVDGIDPSVYTGDNFIGGADVRMWYRDTIYILKDTIITGNDVRGNSVVMNLYYTDVFKPDYGERIDIEALLPDGRRLNSHTTVPERVTFPLSSVPIDDPTRLLPGAYSSRFNIFWNSTNQDQFYRTKFKIIYDKYYAYDDTRRSYEVPMDYVERNGAEIPVSARVTQDMGGYFNMNALDRAMQKLSEGHPVKSDFRIFYLTVEVTILDQFMAAYYSSVGNLEDEYSISLDKTDYTNVDGGLGIFGSLIKQNFTIYFEPEYIRGFGYQPFY